MKIIAKNKDEFCEIEDKVKLLPTSILENVELVEYGLMGLTCTYKKSDWGGRGVYLPKDTRQISYMGEYIACYCKDVFIKIPFHEGQANFTFNILEN